MNKQELINKLERDLLWYKKSNPQRFSQRVLDLKEFIRLVKEINEPEIKKERAWLKEKVHGLSETITNVDGKDEYVGISKNAVLSLIDQLGKPEKKLQVIVKNYDSTVYKTELPEDEAMKLIEGWKG